MNFDGGHCLELRGEREVTQALIDVSGQFAVLLGHTFPAYSILDECIAGEAFSYDRRLAKVRREFFREISLPFDLVVAASSAGLESHYFSMYFHKSTGFSFSRWRGICRSAVAAWLIAQSRITVYEAALDVGYDNAQALTRTFKREYAVTPRQFVALHRAIRSARKGLNLPFVLDDVDAKSVHRLFASS